MPQPPVEIRIDLSAGVLNRRQINEVMNLPVTSVYVDTLPAGVVLRVHQNNGPGVRLQEFALMEVGDDCDPEKGGIQVSTDAAVPGTLVLMISVTASFGVQAGG